MSVCVKRCEDFAYNWVSNDDTRKCEYCGPTCTLCSAKYGCLADYTWDRGYKHVASDQYNAGQFPFSSKVPSSQFSSTKACADKRCDVCKVKDAIKPNPSSQFAECDSCPTYVNLNFAAKQALLPCKLCDSTNVPNCLNCDPDKPSICISCNEGFYIDVDTNKCNSCPADTSLSAGCRRCSAETCLECMPGYYEIIDGTGRMTC